VSEPLGPCPLCGREMVKGKSTSKHHFVPRSRGGRATERIHSVCHSKIHSLFTNKELETTYSSAEALLEHPEIQKFVAWLQRQPLDFRDKSKRHHTKQRKVG
jgi:hypothetical protein